MTLGILSSTLFGDMFGTAAMREVFGELRVSRALRRGRGGARARPGAARHHPGRRGRGDHRRRPPRSPPTRDRSIWRGSSARPRRSATRSCRWCASSPSVPATRGRYLHWGATTQDIMDTAAVLQIRDGLALIEADLDGGARPSRRARAAATATRRWPGAPICSTRCRSPSATRRRSGSPASTATPTRLRRAAAARAGGAVRRRRRHAGLARRWRGEPRARAPSWRASSASPSRRSPGMSRATAIAETVQFLALLGGSLGKIAFDVMLMSATEFGEAAEPFVAGPRLVLDDAAEAQPDLLRADPRRRQGAAPACRADARRDGQRFRARHRPLACRMDRAAGKLRLCRRRLASGALSCSAG